MQYCKWYSQHPRLQYYFYLKSIAYHKMRNNKISINLTDKIFLYKLRGHSQRTIKLFLYIILVCIIYYIK